MWTHLRRGRIWDLITQTTFRGGLRHVSTYLCGCQCVLGHIWRTTYSADVLWPAVSQWIISIFTLLSFQTFHYLWLPPQYSKYCTLNCLFFSNEEIVIHCKAMCSKLIHYSLSPSWLCSLPLRHYATHTHTHTHTRTHTHTHTHTHTLHTSIFAYKEGKWEALITSGHWRHVQDSF